MILTLSWKECREHWPIWLTMVVASMGLGLLLGALNTGREAVSVAAISVLGMAVTYGVVCGSMMFAGEREAGTMVFLDIFLGRRDLIWFWKFAIGIVLVLSQALLVGAVLVIMKQTPPEWLPLLVGLGRVEQGGMWIMNLPEAGQATWLLVLPVVTLEAYAWGLLGSSLSRRVVNGAACAALMAAPMLLLILCAPPPIFLGIRGTAALIALVASGTIFLNQSKETQQGPPPRREEVVPLRPRRRRRSANWTNAPLPVILVDPPSSVPLPVIIIDEAPTGVPYAQIIDEEKEVRRPEPQEPDGIPKPVVFAAGAEAKVSVDGIPKAPAVAAVHPLRFEDAQSSFQVLLWLTLNQAGIMFSILAAAAFFIGFFVPAQGQLLWPAATLLLGVACGTAAFAQEQSDLSYQFLAALHLPLKKFWNVKILFWFLAAAGTALLALASGALLVLLRSAAGPQGPEAAVRLPARFDFGNLREIMGPVLFFGMWLVYGFCIGQVFVLLCRKSVLAALLSGLVTAGALGVWLPTVLCLGMSGWQVLLPPLAMLLATRFLIRPWAAGRIKERRPIAALIGIGLLSLAWAGLVFSRRAWEIPDVGEPMDRSAFKKTIPTGNDNKAGPTIEEALAEFSKDPEGPKNLWILPLAKATRLPVGVIAPPSGDGQKPLLRHLEGCGKMTLRLHELFEKKLDSGRPEEAFEHVVQILALSRNLRNKAPPASYLEGLAIEDGAMARVLSLLKEKRSPKLLRHMLDELNRHAAETPPLLDCLNTECFRAGGALAYPTFWGFFSGDAVEKIPPTVPERWLAGGIAFSLDTPWEKERAIRLWRLVWAGLYRNLQTSHWQLPEKKGELKTAKEATRKILQGWSPAKEGAGASMTAEQLAALLDASWLSDEKLFCQVMPLRTAATQSRWRVDSSRLAVALTLYQLQEGKTATKLADLVPKYLPKLPIDPYSGEDYHYRISKGEVIDAQIANVAPGQAILWSTGPDRINNGGVGRNDLITVIPHWP
jgi:hypothetical protein